MERKAFIRHLSSKRAAPGAPPRPRRAPGSASVEAGFTILEILIATAILSIGLVCILGLFPLAIDSGKKVMEQSTAVTVAKSVADQIRVGLRNEKRYVYTGAEPFTYFIFQHDGVMDPVPRDRSLEKPRGDYFILLPQFRQDSKFESSEGATEEERDLKRREMAVRASHEFVYPEDDEPMNGGGSPFNADDDGDDGKELGISDGGILVRKVYTVGNLFPKAKAEGLVSLEDQRILDDQVTETLKQYSFAFSIRASKFDTNLSQTPKTFQPGNILYHVRVMVFRAFLYNEEKVRVEKTGQDPVYELDFEVSR